ncbi:MAG: homoserine kinase [Sphingomonadaceae bacterium]
MAVYTDVPAERLVEFLGRYGLGELTSFKGIAEGVSNSNFLVETAGAQGPDRFILTLYERRIDPADLPWFIALMEHLADRGLPVPRPMRDRECRALQTLAGRHACLIRFLPGVSVSAPTATQAAAAGRALAQLHLAGRSFTAFRPNGLGLQWWNSTAGLLGPRLDTIEPGLAALVSGRLDHVRNAWPADLPKGTIHADLFPDNVLMLGDEVSGLIDFYFACSDLFAYDLAVLLNAWAFPADGTQPLADRWEAALAGYGAVRPLDPAERAALPVLCEGAALRFLLSRAQDWLEPAEGALVARKDPLPFARRLAWHAAHG